MKATIPNRLSFSFWLSYLKGLVYGLCSWRFFVSLTAPRRSMWKASGRWVARKSFCIVCCCFGTQTGLRKKKQFSNSFDYHWNMLILSRAKNQRWCNHQPKPTWTVQWGIHLITSLDWTHGLVTPLKWHSDVADSWIIELCSSGYV